MFCTVNFYYVKMLHKNLIFFQKNLPLHRNIFKKHQKFRRRFKLPFPLLVDADHAVAEAYGAWGQRSLFGYRYHGILRTTFLIDAGGRIKRIFEKVKPMGHAAQVLEALSA